MNKKDSKNKKLTVFDESHYKSDNGFSTYIWGPCMWQFLHIMTFNYPVKPTPKQKKDYKKFLELLQVTLPCGKCRENYAMNIKADDTKLTMNVMKDRESLSKWLCKLHNKINKQIGKNTETPYDECRDFYEQFRARCTKTKGAQHGGCTIPIHKGIKSKTVLRIVPRNSKVPTLKINKKCLCKRKT